jgi:hypothetical protein
MPALPTAVARHVECASEPCGDPATSPPSSASTAWLSSAETARSHRLPEQSEPPHGAWHLHVLGAVQSPRPLQSLAQVGCAHAAPFQPGAHVHRSGAVHVPWPEQPAVQMGREQLEPDQPSAHAHLFGPRHVPRAGPLQLFGQTARPQLGPPQPESHVHSCATTQCPWPLQSVHATCSHERPE